MQLVSKRSSFCSHKQSNQSNRVQFNSAEAKKNIGRKVGTIFSDFLFFCLKTIAWPCSAIPASAPLINFEHVQTCPKKFKTQRKPALLKALRVFSCMFYSNALQPQPKLLLVDLLVDLVLKPCFMAAVDLFNTMEVIYAADAHSD